MVTALIGKKIDQAQAFLEDGTRVPVTSVVVSANTVVLVKQKDKHGYDAVQLAFGQKKKATKAELGQAKGAKLEKAPFLLKEVKLADAESLPEVGAVIALSEIFKPGDVIDVMGFSKGKGYAGVVKRHNFKGGPRTHGQSDRERAPGSIGQTTTPGRVYKGKRMAGRMGSENVTIKNLQILDIKDEELIIKGLIPGIRGGHVVIEKVGEAKKFTPLWSEPQEEVSSEETPEPEVQASPEVQIQPEVQVEAEQKVEEVEKVEQEIQIQPEIKEEAK